MQEVETLLEGLGGNVRSRIAELEAERSGYGSEERAGITSG